jgi:NRDE-2, necessary for RNA interference
VRLTVFLRESGYEELSIAFWQSELEFVLFRPPNIPPDEAEESFESYFDSEACRLGEAANAGWRAYQDHEGSKEKGGFSTNLKKPDAMSNMQNKIKPNRSIFRQFVQAETTCEQSSKTPGRSYDNVDEDDDPYRVILGSDILQLVSVVLTGREMFRPLAIGFLCYCGLPPIEVEEKDLNYGEWWLDPFLRSQGSDLWTTTSLSGNENTYPMSWRWNRMTTDILFQDAFPDYLPTDSNFTRLVLGELVQNQPEWSQLAEYFVAFQLKYSGIE